MDTVCSFLNALYSVRSQGDEDKCCWVPSKRRSFEVRTFYKVLLSNVDYSFPWKSIRRSKAPLRVAFFTWTTYLGKILTMDNLHERHIIVIDWCCMCKKSGKTPDQVFFHCDIARDLWNLVFRMFGVE